MKFYILWFRLNTKDRFLLWSSNDTDKILIDEKDDLLVFNKIEEARTFAIEHKLELSEEQPMLHDLDYVVEWLQRSNKTSILDCRRINTAWNLFIDVSASVSNGNHIFKENDNKAKEIYDKIFHGCNLPVLAKEEHQYVLKLKHQELSILRNLLHAGLHLFLIKLGQKQ